MTGPLHAPPSRIVIVPAPPPPLKQRTHKNVHAVRDFFHAYAHTHSKSRPGKKISMKLVAKRSLGDQGVAGMTADEIADAVMKLDKVCALLCLPACVTLSHTA